MNLSDFLVVFVLVAIAIWSIKRISYGILRRKGNWKNGEGTEIGGAQLTFPFGNMFDYVTSALEFGRTMSRRFGPVYRMWMGLTPVFVIGDPQTLREFYKDQILHDKVEPGFPFSSILGECLGVKRHFHWQNMLKWFRPAFSPSQVAKQTQFICDHAVDWALCIRTGEKFSPVDQLARWPFHILSQLMWGDALSDPLDRNELNELDAIHSRILLCVFTNRASKLPGYRFLPTALNRDIADYQSRWKAFDARMREKIGSTPGNISIVQSIISQDGWNRTEDKGLTLTEWLHTLDEILFANVDVTGPALAWPLVFLAQYPQLQESIRADILESLSDKELDLENESHLSAAVQTALTCRSVRNFLSECGRMRPAMALSTMEKTVTRSTLGEYDLPPGTHVGVDTMTLNFHSDYWQAPDEFNPDRWEEPTPPYAYFRYGIMGNTRVCLGYRFANVMLQAITVAALLKYRIRFAPGSTDHMGLRPGMAFIAPASELIFETL